MEINYLKSDSNDIRTEACTWMAQLETGEMKPADVDAFREWMKRSPRHASEMRRLASLSSSLNVLTEMAGPLQDAAYERKAAVEASDEKRFGKAGFWVTATAFATVMIAVATFLLTDKPAEGTLWQLQLSTDIGGYKEQVLPDGSVVELNTDSLIDIEFTDKNRNVSLTRGEVMFTVSHDPSRPFTVTAGNRSVVAVGTAFVVRSEKEKFEVTVAEGKVRLKQTLPAEFLGTDTQTGQPSSLTGQEFSPKPGIDNPGVDILLKKGQRVALLEDRDVLGSGAPALQEVSETELRRELAWQEGLLEFTDTALSQVIQEVSRHTTLNIEIPDPDLREIRFGGLFRTGDTEPLFEALQAAYNIQAVYVQDDTVVLTRSDS